MGVTNLIRMDAPLYVMLPTIGAIVILAYLVGTSIYNVYFHPLRIYPGPKLWAMTQIPYALLYLSGEGHNRMLDLHKIYGAIVRVAPNTLCYNHPDAMKQIRGLRPRGKPENGKDPCRNVGNENNIIGANSTNHARYRRVLANGFSHQAMLDQQPTIKKYINLLFDKLKVESNNGDQKVDVVRWFNYTTFDIIGDLCFGEPFGCLEDSAYHPWVALIFNSMKHLAFISMMRRFKKWFPLLAVIFLPKGLAAKAADQRKLVETKVRKRLAAETDRLDFMTAMTTAKTDKLRFDELVGNASMLVVAGSETIATALSAATYYLAINREPLEKLVAEITSAFKSEDDMNMLNVQQLSYLRAVIDESLRMYPPVVASGPRITAEGGDTILGHYVPEGTYLEVWQWALFHNPSHFRQHDEFIPERWLGDERFDGDAREAFHPFSVGPRNCIGKNLAYAEMPLILARLVWNFDFTLAAESRDWDKKSKVYMLFEKGPVNVYLKPRSRAA